LLTLLKKKPQNLKKKKTAKTANLAEMSGFFAFIFNWVFYNQISTILNALKEESIKNINEKMNYARVFFDKSLSYG
jgi:hypothetical protein